MTIQLAIGTRVRKSPFFESTRRAGCNCYTVYNHTYMPVYYKDPVADYRHLVLNDPVLLRLEQNKFRFSLADNDILLWVKGVAINASLQVQISEPDVSPLQIQGPKAVDGVSKLFGEWTKGWSNEKGFEVFLKDSRHGERLWDLIMEAGSNYGIAPAAPSQIKRMEAGLLSYRNDMDATNNPYEVGLGKFVDLDQDIDFIGKDALKKIKANGPKQQMMGAFVEGDPLTVNGEHWPVLAVNADSRPEVEQVIGKVTSAVHSPALQQNLVYVMLKIQEAVVDRQITIVLPGNEKRNAVVRSLPFATNKAR